MTRTRSPACARAAAARRRANSRAAAGSWIEHGPTTTSRRSSWPERMEATSRRAPETSAAPAASSGRRSSRSHGAGRGLPSAVLIAASAGIGQTGSDYGDGLHLHEEVMPAHVRKDAHLRDGGDRQAPGGGLPGLPGGAVLAEQGGRRD